MHIVHLTPYYAPAYAFGGVVRVVEGMAQALIERGHRVTVLTTDAHTQNTRTPAPTDEQNGNLRIIRVRNQSVWLRGKLNLSTPFAMRQHAANVLADADVVHVHEFRTAENLLVTPQAHRQHVPLVLSPHGTLTPQTGRSAFKSLWDTLISPPVARRFDAVIGLTDHERTEAAHLWQTFGASSAFHVVPNGVRLSDFANLPNRITARDRFGLPHDRRVVLFMARLHPRKGADILTQAFQQANLTHSHLLIVGPDEGLRPTLDTLAANDDRITLTGYLDGDARLAALAAADVFVLPAIGEGLPMAVLEAMACGLPVIISEDCHLPEVPTHSTGIEAPVSIEGVAQALHHIFADDLSRQHMGEAGRRLIESHFTWQSVAVQLEAIYEEIQKQG